MAGTFPQGWEETALVSIDLFPGTVLTFQLAISDSIGIDFDEVRITVLPK
ncbi:hypothetical protein LCGC14_1208740 [marine sediment metagenome]|uniref:Uncharacterized protein n=1 Tax=marine sediment metagenome TaxID=412755 RepID=A0A0F9LEP0_9ZZZZ